MNAPLTCPACGGTLYPKDWQGLELDTCGHCDGIWFDLGEMVLVSDSGSYENIDRSFKGEYRVPDEALLKQQQNAPERKCPKDTTVMIRHEYEGNERIMLDYCPTCQGVWMDPGELEAYVKSQKDWEKNPPQATDTQIEAIRNYNENLEQETRRWVLAQNRGWMDPLMDALWKIRNRCVDQFGEKPWTENQTR